MLKAEAEKIRNWKVQTEMNAKKMVRFLLCLSKLFI